MPVTPVYRTPAGSSTDACQRAARPARTSHRSRRPGRRSCRRRPAAVRWGIRRTHTGRWRRCRSPRWGFRCRPSGRSATPDPAPAAAGSARGTGAGGSACASQKHCGHKQTSTPAAMHREWAELTRGFTAGRPATRRSGWCSTPPPYADCPPRRTAPGHARRARPRRCRIRPTSESSTPAAANGVGTSTSFTPGAPSSSSRARSGDSGRANSALIDSECPVNTGTRTQVPLTSRSGMPRILRLSRAQLLVLVGLARTRRPPAIRPAAAR